ncbi:sensor histidine kinase [Paenibacillus sp. J5C_2022]|uniref:cache domain-containing sensor histidine kinase n=1 Tax=Paenibacillus sp. J5C2022 TaxID=2977129 RepID=UPI0021D1C833|nr:sensor histidine kinase [Paenibacillus sp. J5C2022]MCU6709145.1 sensor histidine kinase [Paenibacillus sp. J5C2022]
MKKMLNKRNHSTIKNKLMVIVIGHLLLFSVLLFTLFMWFQSVLENKISALAMQTMDMIINHVDLYMENHIRLSDTIAIDSNLIKLLREHSDFSSPGSVWSMVQLLEKLKSFSAMNQNIDSVAIYNMGSRKILSTTDGIFNMSSDREEWEEVIGSSTEPLTMIADAKGVVPDYAVRGRSMISVMRKLPGRNQEHILLINFNKKILDMYTGSAKLWQGTGIAISDERGKVFYTARLTEEQLDKMPIAKKAYDSIAVMGQKYIVVNKTSHVTGWTTSLIIPYREIMYDVLIMQRVVVVIFSLLAVIMLFTFGLLYMQIFNPIKRLIQSMVQIEKGLSFKPIPIDRMDELGYLQKRFNDMVHNEQSMRKTIYEEQLHKKDIELKFLQSQVNPHFLYNTLDSIYWIAEERELEEISEVVLDLSRFFRLSLSRGKDYVSVKESVEHLDYYLRLQQFRHTDKFEVIWAVDEELRDIKIMKLMLQPIVENAIVHSLERAAEPCQLTIAIYREHEAACFTVTDTGIGIGRDRLSRLMKEIMREDGVSGTTYGLRNLYQRLLIQYGDDMSFEIRSEPMKGTCVSVRIRLKRLGGERA